MKVVHLSCGNEIFEILFRREADFREQLLGRVFMHYDEVYFALVLDYHFMKILRSCTVRDLANKGQSKLSF